MSLETKDTNPKDTIGSTKLDMGLVPDTAVASMALAFTEGALKYGRYNWRIAGVRASIYHAAARRHLAKWWNGEQCDQSTGVPHLASVMACCAILLDAASMGKISDDRPPSNLGVPVAIDYSAMTVKALMQKFEGHDPHQYTIADDDSR